MNTICDEYISAAVALLQQESLLNCSKICIFIYVKQTGLLLFSEQEIEMDSLFLGHVVYETKAVQHLFSTDARVKLLSVTSC